MNESGQINSSYISLIKSGRAELLNKPNPKCTNNEESEQNNSEVIKMAEEQTEEQKEEE